MRGLGLLAVLSAAALLLALTPLDPKLTYGFLRNSTATSASAPIDPSDNTPYSRRNVRFDSHGTACDAWLYTPANRGGAAAAVRYPVMIMGHGLGAQKELGLHRFADAFARAGLAVLVFDYRTFGGSDGEPRHWASPRRHLEDWREALRFVKSGGLGAEYDTDKVALWGTSYAGGHALVVASEQPLGSLAAVVSMIPHLDGLAASKANVRRRGLLASLRLVAAGLHDRARAAVSEIVHRAATWLQQPDIPPLTVAGKNSNSGSSSSSAGEGAEAGSLGQLVEEVRRRLRNAAAPLLRTLAYPLLSPAYVKLVGLEGDLALMELSQEQLHAYFSKHPKVYEGGWRPVVLSRFTLETSSYSPVHSIPRVTAPVLFVSALKDQLCPAELVRNAAALLPPANGSSSSGGGESGDSSRSNSSVGGSELLELNCTHFEAYLGEHLAAATEAMVKFVTRYMAPPPPPPPSVPSSEVPPVAATPASLQHHAAVVAYEGAGDGGAAEAEAGETAEAAEAAETEAAEAAEREVEAAGAQVAESLEQGGQAGASKGAEELAGTPVVEADGAAAA